MHEGLIKPFLFKLKVSHQKLNNCFVTNHIKQITELATMQT